MRIDCRGPPSDVAACDAVIAATATTIDTDTALAPVLALARDGLAVRRGAESPVRVDRDCWYKLRV